MTTLEADTVETNFWAKEEEEEAEALPEEPQKNEEELRQEAQESRLKNILSSRRRVSRLEEKEEEEEAVATRKRVVTRLEEEEEENEDEGKQLASDFMKEWEPVEDTSDGSAEQETKLERVVSAPTSREEEEEKARRKERRRGRTSEHTNDAHRRSHSRGIVPERGRRKGSPSTRRRSSSNPNLGLRNTGSHHHRSFSGLGEADAAAPLRRGGSQRGLLVRGGSQRGLSRGVSLGSEDANPLPRRSVRGPRTIRDSDVLDMGHGEAPLKRGGSQRGLQRVLPTRTISLGSEDVNPLPRRSVRGPRTSDDNMEKNDKTKSRRASRSGLTRAGSNKGLPTGLGTRSGSNRELNISGHSKSAHSRSLGRSGSNRELNTSGHSKGKASRRVKKSMSKHSDHGSAEPPVGKKSMRRTRSGSSLGLGKGSEHSESGLNKGSGHKRRSSSSLGLGKGSEHSGSGLVEPPVDSSKSMRRSTSSSGLGLNKGSGHKRRSRRATTSASLESDIPTGVQRRLFANNRLSASNLLKDMEKKQEGKDAQKELHHSPSAKETAAQRRLSASNMLSDKNIYELIQKNHQGVGDASGKQSYKTKATKESKADTRCKAATGVAGSAAAANRRHSAHNQLANLNKDKIPSKSQRQQRRNTSNAKVKDLVPLQCSLQNGNAEELDNSLSSISSVGSSSSEEIDFLMDPAEDEAKAKKLVSTMMGNWAATHNR